MLSKKNQIMGCALVFFSCAKPSEIISEIFSLPSPITEASAVEVTEKSDKIWTLQDSGNSSELFSLDADGKITNTIAVKNAPNTDWEDLTSDKDGNLYIGDFGNNKNERKELHIFKINASDLNNLTASTSRKISFYYPEQKEFPPKKSERIYDAEAFFLFNNNFYVFTKNRSSKFDGTTLLYRIPNSEGRHAAQLIGQFKTCDVYRKCAITSADISPDGTKIVLLSSSKIWLFENFTGDNFFNGKATEIDLEDYSQKEGICFVNDSKLYVTDEKDKKSGGKLYQIDL